jgi:integrase
MSNRIHFTIINLTALPPAPPGKPRVYYYSNKVAGLAVAVSPRGRKVFTLYRKVQRRATTIPIGPFPDITIAQAETRAHELNAVIARGENPRDSLAGGTLTLDGFFPVYLERYLKTRKSWHAIEKNFARLPEAYRRRRLADFTRSDLVDLHNVLGRERGAAAADNTVALLSSVFNRAREWGNLKGANPASHIKKNGQRARQRFLQKDELPRFFGALATERDRDLRDYLEIRILQGVREVNILEARWRDIDLDRATWVIGITKNGDPLTVQLRPRVVQLLRARPRVNEWVFPGTRAHRTGVKAAWLRFRERAGLPDVQLRDLRRTMATYALSAGVPVEIIGQMLGHRPGSKITAINYALVQAPVQVRALEATERLLTGETEKA